MKQLGIILVLLLCAGLIFSSLAYTTKEPEFCRLNYLAQIDRYIMLETGRIVEVTNPIAYTGSDFAQCVEKKGRNAQGQAVLEIVDTSNCK